MLALANSMLRLFVMRLVQILTISLHSDSLAHWWLLPTPTLGVAWTKVRSVNMQPGETICMTLGSPRGERKGKTQEVCFSLDGGGIKRIAASHLVSLIVLVEGDCHESLH